MPRWRLTDTWKGRDVFVIGGGDSLRNFDWNLLKRESTIGCNNAFSLGKEICDICMFGDAKWFRTFHTQLAKYDGLVFTSQRDFARSKHSWIWFLDRQPKGLSKTKLGWNKNTGSNAINLALILGAKNVYLLGFDMKLSSSNKPNWHDDIISPPEAKSYVKFVKGFDLVAKDLPVVFPESSIINVTDNSNLTVFPKIGVSEFWNTRKVKNG